MPVGFAWAQVSGFTELISRYLHEIPQGTAIPRWAFYDVTVVIHPPLQLIEQQGLIFYVSTPRYSKIEPMMMRSLSASAVSLIFHLILWRDF